MPKENRFLRQYCANIEQVGYRRALAERGVGPPIKYLRHETEAADISVLSREERSTLHARGYSEGQQRANVIETARQLGAPIPPATSPPSKKGGTRLNNGRTRFNGGERGRCQAARRHLGLHSKAHRLPPLRHRARDPQRGNERHPRRLSPVSSPRRASKPAQRCHRRARKLALSRQQ